MTKVRLYLDADAIDSDLVEALRLRNLDLDTALEAGMVHASDDQQLAYAADAGRVLYSFNIRDFMILYGDYQVGGKHHAGIILAPQQRYSIGEQMRRLLKIVAEKSAEDMRDNVEFLSAWG